MKIIFTWLLVAVSIFSHSQNLAHSFMQNQCEHFTDGKGITHGIRMKYNVPCEWDSTKDSRTFLINAFSYDIADSGRIACAIMITKPDPNYKAEDQQQIFKKEWVKDVFQKIGGDLINIKKVDIDAHKWAQYVFMMKIDAPQGRVYQIMICYYFVYNGIGIMFSYKTMSRDEAIGALLYINYLSLFQSLASSIHIYNFWQ